jgi:hypothetical protein
MLQGRRHRSAMIFRAEIFYHQDGREVVDDHAAFEAKDIIAARYMMEEWLAARGEVLRPDSHVRLLLGDDVHYARKLEDSLPALASKLR